jgi:hypothetical protein
MKRGVAGAALALAAACASGQGRPESSTLPAASVSDSAGAAAGDSTLAALQRQIVNGSIIADVQLGANPPMALGACVDPVMAARFELDRRLSFVPDRVPVMATALRLPALPESLRDSEVRTGTVLARFVVDTMGTVIPGSVTIASSPHGLMSAQVCVAILTARFTPAWDDGRHVYARVDMPVRFVP